MRILPPYSLYRLDIRGDRLGTIHIALRRGQTPHNHVRLDHSDYFQLHRSADTADLHRWSQHLKRNYPELKHDNPEPSS